MSKAIILIESEDQNLVRLFADRVEELKDSDRYFGEQLELTYMEEE